MHNLYQLSNQIDKELITNLVSLKVNLFYRIAFNRAFHKFGQAKFVHAGLILGSSQFTILPQLPLKTRVDLKMVKIDLKIIISLR